MIKIEKSLFSELMWVCVMVDVFVQVFISLFFVWCIHPELVCVIKFILFLYIFSSFSFSIAFCQLNMSSTDATVPDHLVWIQGCCWRSILFYNTQYHWCQSVHCQLSNNISTNTYNHHAAYCCRKADKVSELRLLFLPPSFSSLYASFFSSFRFSVLVRHSKWKRKKSIWFVFSFFFFAPLDDCLFHKMHAIGNVFQINSCNNVTQKFCGFDVLYSIGIYCIAETFLLDVSLSRLLFISTKCVRLKTQEPFV